MSQREVVVSEDDGQNSLEDFTNPYIKETT